MGPKVILYMYINFQSSSSPSLELWIDIEFHPWWVDKGSWLMDLISNIDETWAKRINFVKYKWKTIMHTLHLSIQLIGNNGWIIYYGLNLKFNEWIVSMGNAYTIE